MGKEIIALATFLGIEKSKIEEVEDNLYKIEDTEYWVFEDEHLIEYISSVLHAQEMENAEHELASISRLSQYRQLFTVDYDAVLEYCYNEIEAILYSFPRQSISINHQTFIIFEIDG